jgi:competence protein ComGC
MLFSIAIVLIFAIPSLAQQEDAMAKARERQAKMMETQMFMNQLMQLGFNGELRKELEIVDDQVESVKELAQDYQKEMMEFHRENGQIGIEIQKLVKEGKNAEAAELGKDYQDRNREFSESYMDQAAEVLLPHQIKRLKQISKRQGARYSNQFQDEFGIAASFADELGLSAEEKKRLIDTIKEARKEYYTTVADAKKKANEKIMSALTTEQKEKMKEIFGDEYDQQANQRKARIEMMKKQSENQRDADEQMGKKRREMMEKQSKN